MSPPRTSATARAAAGRSPAPNPAPAPEPAPVYVSAMDTYVPIIPDPKPDDIERRFKHPTLTKIENKPDYEQMYIVRGRVCSLFWCCYRYLNLADIISKRNEGK